MLELGAGILFGGGGGGMVEVGKMRQRPFLREFENSRGRTRIRCEDVGLLRREGMSWCLFRKAVVRDMVSPFAREKVTVPRLAACISSTV